MRFRRYFLIAACSVAVIASGVSLWRLFKIRYTAYSYRVRQDYRYDFSGTAAVRQQLPITGGVLRLPDSVSGSDTAFLRVNVKSTIPGYFLQPRIDVSGGGVTSSEAVEYGGRGVRYLNISRFAASGGREIRLTGKHVTTGDAGELILFKNREIGKQRVMVIAPHPDDAEIAAFALYGDAAETYIVTVTAGEANDIPGEIPAAQKKAYLQKGRVRVWDALAIPNLAGVPFDHSIILGYFDNTLKSMFENRGGRVSSRSTGLTELTVFREKNISRLISGVQAVPQWSSLVNDLDILISRIRPDIIVTTYPAIDYNTDHNYATVALFEALMRGKVRKGDLYLYTNHYTLTDFYPFGEEGYPITLPPVFGEPIYFRGLYSHPLNDEKMRDKLYALDAMHDLRPTPEWRTTGGAFDLLKYIVKAKIRGRDYSYYRRGVRSNELFFVVPVREIHEREVSRRVLGIDISGIQESGVGQRQWNTEKAD